MERCRVCGQLHHADNPLTFDHIIPVSAGAARKLAFDNAAILCYLCNHWKRSEAWPWLVSLAEEESAAPLERRWAALAVELGHGIRHLELVEWVAASGNEKPRQSRRTAGS